MGLKILKFPHPVLRKKARAVKKVTPEIVKLMDNLLETMRTAPGVGLAAPQVGISLRVIVAELTRPGEEKISLQLANPKIKKKSGKQTIVEGCLSLPGVEAPVERASRVTVKGLNRSGKAVEIGAEDLLATILQHEVDHLEGMVFIDRVEDPSLIKYIPPDKEKKEELL